MILASWKTITYFKPSEFDDPDFPGTGIHANALLVMLLDKLRFTIGCPIHMNHKVGGCVDMLGTHGHSDDSFHLYENGCRAGDLWVETNMSLREQYNYVCRAPFRGIGIYSWWNHPGFHVDAGPIQRTQHWYSPRKGVYDYLFK